MLFVGVVVKVVVSACRKHTNLMIGHVFVIIVPLCLPPYLNDSGSPKSGMWFELNSTQQLSLSLIDPSSLSTRLVSSSSSSISDSVACSSSKSTLRITAQHTVELNLQVTIQCTSTSNNVMFS